MNRPYSLDYARLASGAFYEAIVLVTFYAIFIIPGLRENLSPRTLTGLSLALSNWL